MRTDIVIDDELMKEVMELTGLATKREAVEVALKTLARLKRREKRTEEKDRLARFRGKMWQRASEELPKQRDEWLDESWLLQVLTTLKPVKQPFPDVDEGLSPVDDVVL